MSVSDFYQRISVPTLLLDETKCRDNISRMAEKAKGSGVRFRPHFKTHQSAEVGVWFRDAGVTAITASSLRMAAYFAAHGWEDITVAVPVNIREIDTINALAARIQLGVIVDSTEAVHFLASHLQVPLNIWIEIETGYPRTGVGWEYPAEVVTIAEHITASSLLRLRGLLTHAGHLYGSHGKEEVTRGYRQMVERLQSVQAALAAAGFDTLELSIGDTPSCSLVDDLSAVNEIRPGNFVYYDVMQASIGSCSLTDIAVAVACPVISKNAHRQQIAVYAGSVHLSRDFLTDTQGRKSFGAVALPAAGRWSDPLPDAYVYSVAQEQSVIQLDATTWQQVRIGDIVLILPIHSCLTADLLKHAVTFDGSIMPMLQLTDF